MQGIFENISKKSLNAVRKILYQNLKQAFQEADVQFNELCNLLYAESIHPAQCKKAFHKVLDTLTCAEHFLTKYTKQQMEVIGVDKDCDIKFLKKKLKQYKLNTFELKGGINDRAKHESYFTSNKTERHLIVPLYKEFLSLTNELDEKLDILMEGYDELYQTIHSSDNEQVLKRFNKHFKNVASQISENSGKTYFDILDKIVAVKKESERPSNKLVECNFSTEVIEKIGKSIASIYDKPLELAKTIVKQQWDNSDVDNLFGNIILSKIVYDKMKGVDNLYHTRGRPPENFCYNDCIEALGEMIYATCPVIPKKEPIRTERIRLFNWMVALFISFADYIGDELYGKIASYFRFMEDIGFTPPFGLRHLQQKISDFRLYLREKKKGGFLNLFDGGFSKRWKSKIRRFAPLEKLQEFISEKFMQYSFA